jgi:O-succinylbenzoate synthase
MPALDPLPPVSVGLVEVLRIPMRLDRPFRTARGVQRERDVLLVHVAGDDAEGWSECAVEPAPTYSAEFTDATVIALRDHVLPHLLRTPTDVRLDAERFAYELSDAICDAREVGRALEAIRGHPTACASVQLAVLDAQLRAADRSLAEHIGATATSVAPGAALGLHEDVDALLSEADEACAAGAVRLRVKIAPGRAVGPLRALREHVGDGVILQADANGSFEESDPELAYLDGLDLACLEQPLAPEDLLGHARLADRIDTPICLDEPLTSVGAVEAAIELGACEVVCLKPARVGGWYAAKEVHDLCAARGVPVWVGGMLETGIGRAANLAVAALPHMSLPPDVDPRGRYDPDLTDPIRLVDGAVEVPRGPGTGVVPSAEALARAEVVATWRLVSL